MAVDIHTQRASGGAYRTYISYGHRTSVIDGNFTGDDGAVRTTRPANPYMYGT